MYAEITREYWFSAAHQLKGHPKCGRMHGHNYKVEVTVGGPLHDGMVMDFEELDRVVKPFIDQLDHRYICAHENEGSVAVEFLPKDDVAHPLIRRSTAEYLANWFRASIEEQFQIEERDCHVKEVVVWETHRSKAKATGTR